MAIDIGSILTGELADWRPIRKIGSGGFKEVYLIESGGQQQALKVTGLWDESLMGEMEPEEIETMYRARTEREVHMLERFGGGCVVSLGSIPLSESGTGKDACVFYSEEFLLGQTLSAEISSHRSNGTSPFFEMVREAFRTGVDVIERMWSQKCINRDIKPMNIMLTGDAQRPVVFLDLGIAFDRAGTSLTAQPLGPGTLRYRAPETLDPDYRASIDYRCDLFSLAATVYEYATGSHPIHQGSMSDGETVYRLLKKSAAPLRTLRQDLPAEFCSLIDRCLHKKPALRPNRISEIKKILEV